MSTSTNLFQKRSGNSHIGSRVDFKNKGLDLIIKKNIYAKYLKDSFILGFKLSSY